jgi:hypothetical protein
MRSRDRCRVNGWENRGELARPCCKLGCVVDFVQTPNLHAMVCKQRSRLDSAARDRRTLLLWDIIRPLARAPRSESK